ncbi:hypothetical protein ACM66B_003580 [Microbotryomycetes sp. NB124-2]
MAGFDGYTHDDHDFADLLKQPTLSESSYSFGRGAAAGGDDGDDEDALNANPFADLASSSTLPTSFAAELPSTPFGNAFEYTPGGGGDDSFDASTRLFTRESAPEPETPAFQRYSAAQTDSAGPLNSPGSLDERLGWQPDTPPARQSNDATFDSLQSSTTNPKSALSQLLDNDASTSFKAAAPVASETARAKSPQKTITFAGRRQIRGPLAALLGEEDDGEENKAGEQPSSDPKPDATRPSAASDAAKSSSEPPQAMTETTLNTPQHVMNTANGDVLQTAVAVPLPASRTQSPAPDSADAAVTRASSRVPSVYSRTSSETNTAYDAIVSPMEETADGGRDLSNVNIDGLDQRLSALHVDTSISAQSESTTPVTGSGRHENALAQTEQSDVDSSATEAATAPDTHDIFAAPPANAVEVRSQMLNEPQDETDSLRGNYSRSIEADASEDAVAPQTSSSRPQSPPLPPLPRLPSVPQLPVFRIEVGDPQKVGSSLNVASQHTVYTVRTRTTSAHFKKSDFSVLRRYSHFLWLYDALVSNNPGVIVPGMPEKNALGRFGTDFVENRRLGLEAALTKIVQHPMLVGDPDLRLFLESDTFSVDIKQRKIDLPTESRGLFSSLGSVISGPTFVEFDDFFEQRKHLLDAYETQLRALLVSLGAAAKARQSLHGSMSELQASLLALADCDLSTALKGVLVELAKLQNKLKQLGEKQTLSDERVGGLHSTVETYARLCASAKLVFGARAKAYETWQNAEAHFRKVKTNLEKARRSGRGYDSVGLSVADVTEAERHVIDAKQDFEDVGKLTKAEMVRFDKEKVDDFKRALEDYVDGMAMRQREVVEAWQAYHDMLLNVVAENTPS